MKKELIIDLKTLKNVAIDIAKNDKESNLNLLDLYLTEVEIKTATLPLKERLIIQDKIERLARKGKFFSFISLIDNKLYLKNNGVNLVFNLAI